MDEVLPDIRKRKEQGFSEIAVMDDVAKELFQAASLSKWAATYTIEVRTNVQNFRCIGNHAVLY